jgi:ABC-type dipeptide/oligopeptide/nickel transport system permease subunit
MSELQMPTPAQAPAPVERPPARSGAMEREFTIRERKQWQMVLSRFFRHRAAVVSLIVLFLVALLAFLGPVVWKYTYTDISSAGSSPPTLNNPFGTDGIGHDEFARVLRGAQQSLKVALFVAVLSSGIGVPYGALAGYYGGRIDTIMMRVCDVLLTLPLLAVAGAIVVGHGGTILIVALVLGLLGWVVNARVVRGVVLSLREQEFVEAARALGASTPRIVFRHLSFLGIGVQPPDTSLGVLANEARTAVDTRPWLFYFPGLMIIVIALTVNFIGDGLRDAFDPRGTRQRR